MTREYEIKDSTKSVWDALVNPKTIDKWGGGKAKMSDKEGFEFSLWNGDIHGKNTKVITEKKLEQDWYSGKWEKPSKVVFTLSSENGTTTVKLEHTGIPKEKFDSIKQGWDDYYFGSIKKLLED